MKFLLPLLLLWSAGISAQLVGDKQSGLASYYSAEYNGAETAYGVIYDQRELVAAHKAYPFNSTVRVTNEENGQSVTVRIIDKGPFIRGRIIEVSERAAGELGMLGQRTVPVELTLLSTPDQRPVRTTDSETRRPAASESTSPPTTPAAATRSVPPPTDPAPAPDLTAAAPPPRPSPSPEPAATPTPPRPSAPRSAAPRRAQRAKTFGPGLYRIALDEPEAGRFGVQVGSYRSLESALDKVAELQGRYFDDILLHKIAGSTPGDATYKVILGPFPDQPSAQNYASDLKSRYQIQGFTVALDRN
ncbi:septal ring lytic transglycosylase RlpA family protein [Lewinella sp. IMCC34183]|uniref:septal ring lytic transglycosylase RlpA family protein n=1 Tax=Lewinella sp. IMCC34183 TaxID=2248762 RepID=UPI000E233277|nr:septal ring lytic transglycosylase RlpA family protein [Lewinella sp. IMCC34183]